MIPQEIKQISIREYFGNMGVHPVKDYGYYGMYHCPFRSDRSASFKVDYNKNVWYDFGTNEGGTIIDLVMKMNNCSFHEAASNLENIYSYVQLNSQPFQQPYIGTFQRSNVVKSQHSNDDSSFFHRDSPSITVQNIIPITHPKLIAWVRERKIDLNLANQYGKEIHYRNRDKDYFSIGFRNDKGGYELNNPHGFKGCISPKDITTIRNSSNTCLVFEGFWDFLSYLMLQKVEESKHDIAVLNSVANVQKAMDFLKSHKEIYTYLDNDEAGRKATELIKSNCVFVNNCSERYIGFKDLNDYLCCRSTPKQAVKKKPGRGLKM